MVRGHGVWPWDRDAARPGPCGCCGSRVLRTGPDTRCWESSSGERPVGCGGTSRKAGWTAECQHGSGGPGSFAPETCGRPERRGSAERVRRARSRHLKFRVPLRGVSRLEACGTPRRRRQPVAAPKRSRAGRRPPEVVGADPACNPRRRALRFAGPASRPAGARVPAPRENPPDRPRFRVRESAAGRGTAVAHPWRLRDARVASYLPSLPSPARLALPRKCERSPWSARTGASRLGAAISAAPARGARGRWAGRRRPSRAATGTPRRP